MFRRSRNQGTANRLRIEARPNELSWTSGDADDPAGRGPDPILESDSYEDEAEDELEDDDPQAAAAAQPSSRPSSSARPRSSG